MKKTLLTALLMAGAASVFGQGAIVWGNNPSGFRAPVYQPDPGNPTLQTTGQSSAGTPAGSTVYAGPLIGANSGAGGSYTFAFFAGTSGQASNQLTLLGSTTFRTATGNAVPAGLVVGGTVTVPGAPAGDTAHFQIRVWNNQGGTITTWAAAEAAWLAGLTAAGVTPIVTSAQLGGIDSNSNVIATPVDSGWVSFNVTSVPEPTTFALAGLGAAALMIFRRRK
jgi:hypothetical protein